MKCRVVQHRLLSLGNPEHVQANLRAHLARCSICREWHNQLVLLEQHIALLPIPASNGKAKLMRRFVRETVTVCHSASTLPSMCPLPPTLSLDHSPTRRRSRTLVLGVAAALLLLAIGWLGLQAWLHAAPPPAAAPRFGAPGKASDASSSWAFSSRR